MKHHVNHTDASPRIADSVCTTYRHLHDTLLRRDVTDACSCDPDLKTLFEELKETTEYMILYIGPGHLDDHVTLLHHRCFEGFIVCLKDKNPKLDISVL